MTKYTVEICETLVRQISVEAEDEYEAKEKVLDEYNRGEIVLTADDWCDSHIQVWEEE